MHQSVPPGLVASVASHEPGHGLIRRPDLLHILTEGIFLVTEAALLACILVDILLHLVVEASPTLLQLCQLVFSDVFPSLLIKV